MQKIAPLVLSGRLTLERSWDIKKTVLKAILDHPVVTVVLESVEEIDLSFLQMLCAARKLARDRNKELLLVGRNQPAVDAALARYGFSDVLRCREHCDSCLWQ